MRLAGTWKQYSAKAISQLTRITLKRGAWRYFKCPYQAKVMKILEMVRSNIVVMLLCCHGFGDLRERVGRLAWYRACTANIMVCSPYPEPNGPLPASTAGLTLPADSY